MAKGKAEVFLTPDAAAQSVASRPGDGLKVLTAQLGERTLYVVAKDAGSALRAAAREFGLAVHDPNKPSKPKGLLGKLAKEEFSADEIAAARKLLDEMELKRKAPAAPLTVEEPVGRRRKAS